MTRKEMLEEAKCHYGATLSIIIAAVAAAAAGASQIQAANAQKKSKRNAANASALAAQGGGAADPATTTAERFAPKKEEGLDEKRVSEFLGGQQEAPTPPAVEQPAPSMTAPGQQDPMDDLFKKEQERRRQMGLL